MRIRAAAGDVATALLLVLSACGTGTTGGQVDVAGSSALEWGDGAYGVVLAHGASYDAASWEDQATAIADQGATVVAVEEITPDAIAAAVRRLHERGIDEVALVGGSVGADAILELCVAEPELADQLILLSPNTYVDGLGAQPKLFIASADEPRAMVSEELADAAPGRHNDVVLLPGSTHAQGLFDSDQADRVTTLVLDRLRRYAGP